ncbi:unnamed protein product [Peronospora farinosa]|uniref:Uncharacterized protein n=1 Tax=Peronospora farinosa TaxID=134698 RepID=A0AAV0UG19_9STRA|nr:unnamed protein product [Peronospora farinosa]CAI5734730.1 unnamed protein product [Peronospora farinosa]
MVFTSPRGAVLLPEIAVVSAENSRQLEKRFTFLWNTAHRLLSTNGVLANHMIASMMQLARVNRAQLPQTVLDFICDRCGGLLVPSVSADVRVVSQSRKSLANRRLARQQRRAQLQSDISGTRLSRETLSTIVRVTCHRCQYSIDRPGTSVVHKAKTKKREREEQQTVTVASDTKKRKMFTEEAGENDKLEVARSSAAFSELKMAPTGLFTPVLSSSPRKLLDGPKKRKKKKNTQPDAAIIAVKNNLSSFLQGLNSRK